MAERRMFAKTIIDSDAFIDMPVTARLLYYDLGMRADDDGFVNSPKKIMRMVGASQDDLAILITKKFIIPFDSGVVVIKHWRIHNYIQKDRYKPTKYQEEKAQITVKDNGAYTECIQNVSNMDTQVRLGKVRLGKDRNTYRFTPPTVDEVKQYCSERRNSVDPQSFVDFYQSKGWMVGKNRMKDWKACVRTWERGSGRVSVKVPEFIEQQESGTLPEQEEASEEMIAEIKRLQGRFK